MRLARGMLGADGTRSEQLQVSTQPALRSRVWGESSRSPHRRPRQALRDGGAEPSSGLSLANLFPPLDRAHFALPVKALPVRQLFLCVLCIHAVHQLSLCLLRISESQQVPVGTVLR